MTLALEKTERLRYGDTGMRRVRLGLFAAGLATFALLYVPQPLLPALSRAFVTVYNYLTFRLSAAPFGRPAGVIGALFTVYLAGTWSSTLAGRLADRAGRRVVLAAGVTVAIAGVALTLPSSLALIVAGLVALTAGFFAAHSVASGWVGGIAPVAPAQASALYLCLYYIGSSVAGSAGGIFYAHGGWPLTAALLAIALAGAASLRR